MLILNYWLQFFKFSNQLCLLKLYNFNIYYQRQTVKRNEKGGKMTVARRTRPKNLRMEPWEIDNKISIYI